MNTIGFLLALSAAAAAQTLSTDVKFRPDGRIVEEKVAGEPTTREEGEYNGVRYRFYHTDGSGVFGKLGEPSVRDSLIASALERVRDRTGGSAVADTYEELVGWTTGCNQDAMDDRRHCYAYKDDLWVFVFDRREKSVSVGAEHFPGSSTAVRFGKDKPIVATPNGWRGTAAEAIIARLMKHPTVRTRYRRWPYEFERR